MYETETTILIAADTCERDVTTKMRSQFLHKLQHHPSAPLAWGTAGNPAIGVDLFGKWLLDYKWPPENRMSFQETIASKLAEFNGKQRERSRLAGVESSESELASAIVVGLLEGPFIVEINDRGLLTPIDQTRGFFAIGTGAGHAALVYEVFREFQFPGDNLAKMRYITTFAAKKAFDCELPLVLRRVTDAGIENL